MTTTTKSLEEWEADGAMRFLHGDKIPYPTRDVCTEAEEAAFSRGYERAAREAELAFENRDSPLEFD